MAKTDKDFLYSSLTAPSADKAREADVEEVPMHDATILRQNLALLTGDIQDPKATTKKLAIMKDIATVLVEEIDGLVHIRSLNLNLNLGHGIDLYEEVRKFETHFIRSALERTGGHQTNAAQLLGIKLTTLHQKLKKLGISARQIMTVSDADLG